MAQNEAPGNLAGGAPPSSPLGTVTRVADTTLSDALVTLRKRRWVLIVAVVLGVALGLYRAFTQPRLYEPVGRIQVRTGSADQYKLTAASGIGQDTLTRMMTESAILQSDTLLVNVARDLNLANNRDFVGGVQPLGHRDLNDPFVRQDTLHILQSNLKVTLQPRTDIIRISYSSVNAKLSADIVNTVIDAYMQRSYETRFGATQRVSKFLSKQLDDLRQHVETSQEEMLEVGRRLGIQGLDSTHNQASIELDDLTKAAGQAELASIVAESRYRMLAGMDPDSIEGSIDSTPGVTSGLNALRNQLATAKANYAELEANLGPNHPQAKASKAQVDELAHSIDQEQKRLLVQARENYLISKANEDKTKQALEAQKTEAYKLRNDLVEYTLKQRDFEASRTLYEGLLERLRTAGIQAGLESTEIDVVDQAVPPATPSLKPKSVLVLTTLTFCVVVGTLLAFVLDSLDSSLRSVTEVEAVTEMPSLAVIPRSKPTSETGQPLTAVQSNLLVLTQPKSQFAESFRALRTAILLSSAGREPRIIMFTSATPAEGKTSTSTNFSCILAQRGSRVLLIDADLRRPSVHHRFGLSGKLGLSTVLSGSSTLEESVQHIDEVPTLDVLASGPIPPFPTELLSSESMRELLEHARHTYTHIIIDSPPILSVTDGVVLASLTDAVVLVIRHAKTSKHTVRRARDLLIRSNAPLKGIVLNAVDVSDPEYYGYYGYSGYGGYGDNGADPTSWEKKKHSSGSGKGGRR